LTGSDLSGVLFETNDGEDGDLTNTEGLGAASARAPRYTGEASDLAAGFNRHRLTGRVPQISANTGSMEMAP
jgi:hypothetical protein